MAKKFLIGIVLIIIFISIGGWYLYEQFRDKSEICYEYYIEINSKKTVNNYTVILPIPVNYEGTFYPEEDNFTISKIVDHLKICEGYGNYTVVNTVHGYGIEINSNDTFFKMISEGKNILDINVEGDVPKVCLSMRNNTDKDGRFEENDYWVFANISPENESLSVEIGLHLKWTNRGGYVTERWYSGIYENRIYEIHDGWQIIEIPESTLNVD